MDKDIKMRDKVARSYREILVSRARKRRSKSPTDKDVVRNGGRRRGGLVFNSADGTSLC